MNVEMAEFLVKEMGADVNLMNKGTGNNILSEAILRSDYWAVKFIVKELKANASSSPIHNAMWADFQRYLKNDVTHISLFLTPLPSSVMQTTQLPFYFLFIHLHPELIPVSGQCEG